MAETCLVGSPPLPENINSSKLSVSYPSHSFSASHADQSAAAGGCGCGSGAKTGSVLTAAYPRLCSRRRPCLGNMRES